MKRWARCSGGRYSGLLVIAHRMAWPKAAPRFASPSESDANPGHPSSGIGRAAHLCKRGYDPARGLARCSSPRRAATAPASSGPSRRSRRRSTSTGRRSTSASRSSTTSTSCAISRPAAPCSSTTRREVPEGETVVFSAHGVAPSVHANAAARGLQTIDATCPLVTKVHVQARRYAEAGYTIVLIGHEGHEEVVGTMGEAPGLDRARRIGRRRRSARRSPRTRGSPT